MLDLAVWLIAGSCLLFVLSGVLWGWWLASLRRSDPSRHAVAASLAPHAPPPPSPVPPPSDPPPPPATHPHIRAQAAYEVDLCDGGRVRHITVGRRSARIIYENRAWDHTHNAENGRWQYQPTDPMNKATRQAQARASR